MARTYGLDKRLAEERALKEQLERERKENGIKAEVSGTPQLREFNAGLDHAEPGQSRPAGKPVQKRSKRPQGQRKAGPGRRNANEQA